MPCACRLTLSAVQMGPACGPSYAQELASWAACYQSSCSILFKSSTLVHRSGTVQVGPAFGSALASMRPLLRTGAGLLGSFAGPSGSQQPVESAIAPGVCLDWRAVAVLAPKHASRKRHRALCNCISVVCLLEAAHVSCVQAHRLQPQAGGRKCLRSCRVTFARYAGCTASALARAAGGGLQSDWHFHRCR